MKMKIRVLVFCSIVCFFLGGSAQQCGRQVSGALCAGGLCCSQYGWCGTTPEYCDINQGCQSQCTIYDGDDISNLISKSMFDDLFRYQNDPRCPSQGFYSYDAFIAAAKAFPAFAATGDNAIRKREIAAFLAQTSHETTGGWHDAPGGPQAWGYCFVNETNDGTYCQEDPNYPCAPGKKYYGRGPMQLTWNYNYGQCGNALGLDLLNNPDLVATDPLISFKAALWFWMTPQSPKPSCHDVIIGTWQPSPNDVGAGRLPGFGVTTNIINGGLECGNGSNVQVKNRILFYYVYCLEFEISTGDNVDCYDQRSFADGLLVETM